MNDDDSPLFAVAQANFVQEAIVRAIAGEDFTVTPDLVRELNRLALGLDECRFRHAGEDLEIAGSRHAPPKGESVADLVDAFCTYVNRADIEPIHAAAFALWRLCWIHPFVDGNGRTARGLCYLVYCAREKIRLPGRVLLPERICWDKRSYYNLLAEADTQCRTQKALPKLTNLEQFLGRLLRDQVRDTG